MSYVRFLFALRQLGRSAGFLFPVSIHAQSTVDAISQASFEEQRMQQRDARQQEAVQRFESVRLADGLQPIAGTLAALGRESPCFAIQEVSLQGEASEHFEFVLQKALAQASFVEGQCIGVAGIDLLSRYAQNALIERGYTTSRIVVEAQDLSRGVLYLTVLPGYIESIQLQPTAGPRVSFLPPTLMTNEIPTSAGELFNLRDIEQGLENYRRLRTVQATIRIEPGAALNSSRVFVDWDQRTVPLSIALGVDNSGSKQTGRYLGQATLRGEGLAGLSDLFYVSYGRSLGDRVSLTDSQGHRTRGKTHHYNVHYSVPFGYWQLFYDQSYYRYHQAIAGAYENYDYNGRSLRRALGLNRVLYRDRYRKTQASFSFWSRRSHQYIGDAEIEVQRKRMGGWQASLTHHEYIGSNYLGLNVSYRRGTGAFSSEQPAEHLFGEGTSRMRVITADVNWQMPFQIAGQSLVWDSRLHMQFNKSRLVAQDQLALGGRYTVRGFDGELYLMAERGWYWRNDLTWQYQPNHQLYVGIDVGRVSGSSAEYLLGQSLAGGVVGLRGVFALSAGNQSLGQWYYDLFVGTPIKKPSGFKTKSTVLGFNVNYSF